jgi:urea transport system ATP-binding protein
MTPDLLDQGASRMNQYQAVKEAADASGGRIASYSEFTNLGNLMWPMVASCTWKNVNVSFDGFKAINNLSLDIGLGELRCIIGPNGAGKTTMMDIITGKTKPQSGRVFFGSTINL